MKGLRWRKGEKGRGRNYLELKAKPRSLSLHVVQQVGVTSLHMRQQVGL